MYKYYNPNPKHKNTSDCIVRAISKLENLSWDDTYWELAEQGFIEKTMPDINSTWGSYLISIGYRRHIIPNTCPNCYTIMDFCQEHPFGKYLLATGEHVVAVIDGDYYDSGDSGYEVPVYYWKKESEL